jgi:hypothetical protein
MSLFVKCFRLELVRTVSFCLKAFLFIIVVELELSRKVQFLLEKKVSLSGLISFYFFTGSGLADVNAFNR